MSKLKDMKTILLTLLLSVGLFAQNERLNDRFAFLQQIYFENTHGRYDRYLESSLEAFLQKHPHFDQADQIILMLGDVQLNSQKPYSAFIQYIKTPTLYPKSDIVPNAKKKLNQLLKKIRNVSFLEKKDSILNYVNQKHYFDSPEEATVDLYNFLFSLNIPKLRRPLLADLNRFTRSCRSLNQQGDVILYLKGRLNEALGNFLAAEANFRELMALYKKSLFYPDALFYTAFIDYKHLKKFEEAKNDFVQIINTYPDNENAPRAQFYLADLYANGLDSLNAGIDNYRLFVDAFPEHPLFKSAFKRLTLLLFKTKRYEEAVTLIGLHLNKHAQDSTFYSLVDSMAQIFTKRFKKYEYAARCYVLLASTNPHATKSPYYLYQAARIYRKFLKDYGRAADICLRLKKNYPESPYSVKCQLLIKKRVKK